MNALVNKYNFLNNASIERIDSSVTITIPCKIASLMTDTYGKLDTDNAGTTNFMEYSQFLSLIANYLPDSLNSPEFKAFLLSDQGMLN